MNCGTLKSTCPRPAAENCAGAAACASAGTVTTPTWSALRHQLSNGDCPACAVAASIASRIGRFSTTCVPMRIASRIGTPLPNRMPSVRVKRAVLLPRVSRPTSGSRTIRRCTRRLNGSLRMALAKAMAPATIATSSIRPIADGSA